MASTPVSPSEKMPSDWAMGDVRMSRLRFPTIAIGAEERLTPARYHGDSALDRGDAHGYLWCTSRLELPHDLYKTLLTVWRSSVPGSSPGNVSGRAGAVLSQNELHSVSSRVRELSRGLTRERALAGERYLSDPGFLGAYLLHFWPISYAQALLCLAMLHRTLPAAEAGLGSKPHLRSVLDLGAGPGPISIALLETGATSVTACDRSAAALALARRIASDRGHELATRQWDAVKSTGMPRGPFDMVILGHTLNELWAGQPDRIELRIGLLKKLGEELSPRGRIMIIEPALMGTAQEAIRVRDGLVKAGFLVEMPCIWQQACPALPDGTCHGEFDWRPPAEMVRLAHAARIGRETLKMAWFVLRKAGLVPGGAAPGSLQPDGASPDGGLYRVVSEPLLSKSGRIRYLVCGPAGRFALSASRECRAAGIRPFFGLARGDGVRFSGARRRETGWGLDDESSIDVVEPTPRLK
jgi:SAM-dependent methyltransferase